MPGSMHHVSGREMDVQGGGEANIQIRIVLNLNVSFLQVKISSFDHANVWSPKL